SGCWMRRWWWAPAASASWGSWPADVLRNSACRGRSPPTSPPPSSEGQTWCGCTTWRRVGKPWRWRMPWARRATVVRPGCPPAHPGLDGAAPLWPAAVTVPGGGRMALEHLLGVDAAVPAPEPIRRAANLQDVAAEHARSLKDPDGFWAEQG